MTPTANPQAPHELMEVCDSCGWPPAGDGRCLCAHPEHGAFYGRYAEYMTENLARLRGLVGLGPIREVN